MHTHSILLEEERERDITVKVSNSTKLLHAHKVIHSTTRREGLAMHNAYQTVVGDEQF